MTTFFYAFIFLHLLQVYWWTIWLTYCKNGVTIKQEIINILTKKRIKV